MIFNQIKFRVISCVHMLLGEVIDFGKSDLVNLNSDVSLQFKVHGFLTKLMSSYDIIISF